MAYIPEIIMAFFTNTASYNPSNQEHRRMVGALLHEMHKLAVKPHWLRARMSIITALTPIPLLEDESLGEVA